LETGEARSWKSNVDLLPTSQAITVERVAYVAKRLSLPTPLPWGYHRLTLEVQGRHFETMVISAPLTAYSSCEEPAKFWGVFLPLYALHSARSWGGGDFSDLEALIKWTAELGGSVVGTLPLLAAFLDEPYDPSPYAPASRLFWNEFYIDLTRIPELKPCSQAQALFESGDVQRDLRDLRASPFVDYRRQMALKQKVLKELAQYFFTEIPERHTSFRRFVEHHPEVEDYARFRAAVERQGAPWPSWPRPLHDGVLKEGDYDETAHTSIFPSASIHTATTSGASAAHLSWTPREAHHQTLSSLAVRIGVSHPCILRRSGSSGIAITLLPSVISSGTRTSFGSTT
jgi:4-alpha-glucanotransferase